MQPCASEVWRANVTMLEIPSRNSIDSNGDWKEGEMHGFETHDREIGELDDFKFWYGNSINLVWLTFIHRS